MTEPFEERIKYRSYLTYKAMIHEFRQRVLLYSNTCKQKPEVPVEVPEILIEDDLTDTSEEIDLCH